MPTQWAHAHYWNRGDGQITPPPSPLRGGVPAWQGGLLAATLWGGLQIAYERLVWVLRWAWRLWRLHRARPEHAAILAQVITLLEHPAYPVARAAVRDTAMTLGFNKPQAWVRLSHALKDRPDWAENSWRHLRAMQQLDAQVPGLTNPERNMLVELAYAGYAARPRG